MDPAIVEHYKGRTILVTGGAGGIGSNLIIALSQLVGEKGRIVVLVNLSAIKYPEPWNVCPLPNILFVKGDVRSGIDLKRVFHEDPSLVFHLAAFFANQSIQRPKTYDDELATTKKSCLGCLADDISWEIYYLLKEKDEE